MSDVAESQGQTDAEKLSRQTLLKRLLGISVLGWLAAIMYPIGRFLMPPPLGEANVSSLNAGSIDDVWDKPFRIIQFGRKPVLLLKDPSGNYRALSATCTHLSCIVQYEDVDNYIWCACHNGKFDLTGQVIAGPPPTALEVFNVNVSDKGEIWISRRQA